jgi:hypothetical protein
LLVLAVDEEAALVMPSFVIEEEIVVWLSMNSSAVVSIHGGRPSARRSPLLLLVVDEGV